MNYAEVYSKLVDGKEDIIGHVAYSLYKGDKRKFIESYREKHGKYPTNDDVEKFVESVTIDTSIERYKMEAYGIISSFLSYALDETTDRIEKDCVKNHEDILKNIIAPIKPQSIWWRYFHAILQSILGAFFFALIAAAFMFIKNYS